MPPSPRVAWSSDAAADGIGVEGVAMARNGAATNWADALPGFTEAIRSESERTGAALPAGFAIIAGATSAPTTTA